VLFWYSLRIFLTLVRYYLKKTKVKKKVVIISLGFKKIIYTENYEDTKRILGKHLAIISLRVLD
jgi:hypothetical protein